MEDPDQLTDEAIVARLAVGNTEAFSVLVARYRRRVYAVLVRATGRPQDADDLFQETWIRVARGAAGFDPMRKFSSWVARIATNVAIDWMRAAATRGAVMAWLVFVELGYRARGGFQLDRFGDTPRLMVVLASVLGVGYLALRGVLRGGVRTKLYARWSRRQLQGDLPGSPSTSGCRCG